MGLIWLFLFESHYLPICRSPKNWRARPYDKFRETKYTIINPIMSYLVNLGFGNIQKRHPHQNTRKVPRPVQLDGGVSTKNLYMDVSENNGTPKSSILIGFSIINHPFWGVSLFLETPISKRWKFGDCQMWWVLNLSFTISLKVTISEAKNGGITPWKFNRIRPGKYNHPKKERQRSSNHHIFRGRAVKLRGV